MPASFDSSELRSFALLIAPLITIATPMFLFVLYRSYRGKGSEYDLTIGRDRTRTGKRTVSKGKFVVRHNPYVRRPSIFSNPSIAAPYGHGQESGEVGVFGAGEMRGIYNMMIMLFLTWTTRSFYENYVAAGAVIQRTDLLWLIVRGLPSLIILVVAMLLLTSFIPLLEIAKASLWRARTTQTAAFRWLARMQYVAIIVIAAAACMITFRSPSWPFSQKLALILEALVLAMKNWSYVVVNTTMAEHSAKDSSQRIHESRASIVAEVAALSPSAVVEQVTALRISEQGTVPDAAVNDAVLRQWLTQVRINEHARSLLYPRHVALADWFAFVCFPTICYEPVHFYPRFAKVRVYRLLSNVVQCIGVLVAMWLFNERYVWPVLVSSGVLSPVEVVTSLMVPMFVLIILGFFLIFEFLLGAVAEMTRFADQCFYGPWWNATTFDEFVRLWNRPVHEFLLRHVYAPTIAAGKSRTAALAWTFVLSTVLHEFTMPQLVLICVFHRLRGLFTVFSLMQIPLIPAMRTPLLKGTPLGNLIVWVGLVIGIPCIATFYAQSYCHMPHVCTDIQYPADSEWFAGFWF